MTEPKNKQLYSKVKAEADEVFKKPSAYKSGWIVREYKKRGGKYLGSKKQDGLTRWFKEEWDDIGGKDYPVYRPTKRITKDTPLTASEIDPKQAKKQIALKQVIKGDKNLPKFQKKIGGYSIMSDEIDYDKLKWGSFTKQFNAQKKKLGVKNLEQFANHIISNPKDFAKKTLQRANFYKNVIKGGAYDAGAYPDKDPDDVYADISYGGNQPDFDAVARQVAQVIPDDPNERERAFARDRPIIIDPTDEFLLDGVADALTDRYLGETQRGGSLIPTDGFYNSVHSSRFLPMYM